MSAEEIIDGMQDVMVDDGGADYIQLYTWLQTTQDILYGLFGLLAVIILIGVPIMVAFELVYINITVFRSSLDSLSKRSERLGRIAGLCFRDAKTAIVKADTANTGRSINFIYLGLKLKVLIITLFVAALALGPINVVIQLIIRLMGSIISLF